LKFAIKKLNDGFMRKDNAIKIQYALNMLVLLIIGKNGWETQGLQKSNAVAVK
jgi:hypothetical protein